MIFVLKTLRQGVWVGLMTTPSTCPSHAAPRPPQDGVLRDAVYLPMQTRPLGFRPRSLTQPHTFICAIAIFWAVHMRSSPGRGDNGMSLCMCSAVVVHRCTWQCSGFTMGWLSTSSSLKLCKQNMSLETPPARPISSLPLVPAQRPHPSPPFHFAPPPPPHACPPSPSAAAPVRVQSEVPPPSQTSSERCPTPDKCVLSRGAQGYKHSKHLTGPRLAILYRFPGGTMAPSNCKHETSSVPLTTLLCRSRQVPIKRRGAEFSNRQQSVVRLPAPVVQLSPAARIPNTLIRNCALH